jgi:hypothetical protein
MAKDAIVQHDEAPTSETHDHHEKETVLADDAIVTGFEADEADLPKGYFRSRFFLGSYFAIGLGLWGGTAAL